MQQLRGTDIWLPDGEVHFAERNKLGQPMAVAYQHDRVTTALPHCRGRHLAVDVGAHVGLVTRALAKHFEQVVAFEPHPLNYECLLANTRHLPNVRCVPLAVGAEVGRAGLDYGPLGNSGNRQLRTGDDVDVVALDDYFADVTPGPDLLKIDVQGYESYVLEGARWLLAYWHPVCIVEYEKEVPLQVTYPRSGKEGLRLLKQLGAAQVGAVSADLIYRFSAPAERGFDKYESRGAYHVARWREARAMLAMVDAVVELLQARGYSSVLDAGAGDGLYSMLLGSRAYGIDSSETAVALARANGCACEVCDILEVSKLGRHFDAVLLADTLEHIGQPEAAIKALGAVADAIVILNPEPRGGRRHRYHVHEMTAAEVTALLARCGWRCVHQQDFCINEANRKSLQVYARNKE